MPRRAVTRLAGGCALLLGISLSGCAAPAYTSVSDPGAKIHFEVPYGWHQFSRHSLARQMKDLGGSGATWVVAFDADPKPKAADFLSLKNAQPFVFVESGPVSSALSRVMSDQMLRDFFLPVTATARRNVAAQGFPFTDFRLIRDQILTLSQGVHGVRDTFDYTLPAAGTHGEETDTFDITALTNAGQTAVFLLAAQCTTVCYSEYRAEIEHVMSSVSVSGPSAPQRTWPGLRGR